MYYHPSESTVCTASVQKFTENPEFRVGNFAVNLKREISHAKLKCHESPPPLDLESTHSSSFSFWYCTFGLVWLETGPSQMEMRGGKGLGRIAAGSGSGGGSIRCPSGPPATMCHQWALVGISRVIEGTTSVHVHGCDDGSRCTDALIHTQTHTGKEGRGQGMDGVNHVEREGMGPLVQTPAAPAPPSVCRMLTENSRGDRNDAAEVALAHRTAPSCLPVLGLEPLVISCQRPAPPAILRRQFLAQCTNGGE